MGQQQGQQQGGGGDNAFAPIWIMLVLFGSGYLIWYFFKVQIISFFFYVTLIQAKIIALFTNKLANYIYLMQTVDPSTVTWPQFVTILKVVGDYVKYPVMISLILLAVWLYFSNVTLKFRKGYSMKTLRNQEQHNWPQIMPVTKLDLINEDIGKGPWAMALSPIEFARKNKLLRRDDFASDDILSAGPPTSAGIKRGESKVVFTVQLGPHWKGYEMLPVHLLALAAIFTARINQDRDGAQALLDTINRSVYKGKLSFLGAKALLKKHVNTESAQNCAHKHAYVMTVLASLLVQARNSGVLASADFLWLKPIDRRAWFMLNSVGRQTPFSEVAAVFAHWKAEIAMGRKSIVPMIDEAIKGLEAAVKEVKLPPRELEELK